MPFSCRSMGTVAVRIYYFTLSCLLLVQLMTLHLHLHHHHHSTQLMQTTVTLILSQVGMSVFCKSQPAANRFQEIGLEPVPGSRSVRLPFCLLFTFFERIWEGKTPLLHHCAQNDSCQKCFFLFTDNVDFDFLFFNECCMGDRLFSPVYKLREVLCYEGVIFLF